MLSINSFSAYSLYAPISLLLIISIKIKLPRYDQDSGIQMSSRPRIPSSGSLQCKVISAAVSRQVNYFYLT